MNLSSKLLIVDDNPVVLLGLSETMRAAGFEVFCARNGAKGLQLARENLPDLILLDVMLPDINGVEVCRQIKADAELKSLFVVLLSVLETSSGSQSIGLDAGADGYIARPIENRELLARVQSLLRIQRAEKALQVLNEVLEERVVERTAELAEANERLRRMSFRLLEVQEAERRFIARELHDEAGQLLTGLKMVLDRSLASAPDSLHSQLNEAVELINLLMGRMRNLSLDLRPQMLDDLGLFVALESHFKNYFKQTGIKVDFRHMPISPRLPLLLETALFRIAQEALTNVARHSGIQEAVVRLWVDSERAGLQVEDAGKGFDVDETFAARISSGVSGMRERAGLLGGEFTIESKAGKGTLLTVELPLTVSAVTLKDGGQE